MKNRPKLTPLVWALFAAMVCQPLLAQERSARDPSSQTDALTANIIVFDSPGGSSCGRASCLAVTGIDSQDTVVGIYFDANQLTHGFYRLADGTFGPIEVASPYCDAYPGCTLTGAINPSGTVVGAYLSGPASDMYPFSGFLRDPSGSYLDFNFPGSGSTDPLAINSAGVVGGTYNDSTYPNAQHLFIRDADGNYTSFDLPGEGCCDSNLGLYSINSRDDVTVVFADGDENLHAFLRESSGNLTAIRPFGAYYVEPTAIDDGGRIIGTYFARGRNARNAGFLRDQAGNYTDLGEYFPAAIDAKGTIIGYHCDPDSNGLCYGFYRLKDGSVALFNPPGAEETFPEGINVHGDIAGFFYDKNNQGHGFLRLNR